MRIISLGSNTQIGEKSRVGHSDGQPPETGCPDYPNTSGGFCQPLQMRELEKDGSHEVQASVHMCRLNLLSDFVNEGEAVWSAEAGYVVPAFGYDERTIDGEAEIDVRATAFIPDGADEVGVAEEEVVKECGWRVVG
jgi:hypothetical protein